MDPLVAFFLGLLEGSIRPGWEDQARLGGAAVLLAIGIFGFVSKVASKR